MRLWIRESERRPNPEPARADARKAMAAGTISWLVAAVALVIARPILEAADLGWLITVAMIGVGLGVVGLIVVALIRRG